LSDASDCYRNSSVHRNNIRSISNRNLPSDIIVSPPTPEPAGEVPAVGAGEAAALTGEVTPGADEAISLPGEAATSTGESTAVAGEDIPGAGEAVPSQGEYRKELNFDSVIVLQEILDLSHPNSRCFRAVGMRKVSDEPKIIGYVIAASSNSLAGNNK